MDKSIKLLYCILGSIVLALLNSSIFEYARIGMFSGGYGRYLLGRLLFGLSDIVSFIGFLLLMVFSVLLIINNIRK